MAEQHTYQYGDRASLDAISKTGYQFGKWYNTEETDVISGNNVQFDVEYDRRLEAQFNKTTHTITVASDPVIGGTVAGGGQYYYGDSCTLTATAASGYHFSYWSWVDEDNGTGTSGRNPYSFTVDKNYTFTAHFEANLTPYAVKVIIDPGVGGMVSGSGEYYSGQTCTLVATANTGYTFAQYDTGDPLSPISKEPTYSFIVSGDTVIYARFRAGGYTITTSSNPVNGGTTSGGGTYSAGQICSVTATPASGFQFGMWAENTGYEMISVSFRRTYNFTVNSDRNLVAVFNEEVYDYLKFVAIDPGVVIGVNITGTPNLTGVSYSTDGTTWYQMPSISGTLATLATANSVLYIKKTGNTAINNASNYITFTEGSSGRQEGEGRVTQSLRYYIKGDIMSLVRDSSSSIPSYACYHMFEGCTGLVDASDLVLPSFTSDCCYEAMFKNCTALVTPPALPSTNAEYCCYRYMFWGCSSIVTPPSLPATTLDYECYNYMFLGCTSLTSTPTLSATTLANACYRGMFYGCASLTTGPALPATVLTERCYDQMFCGCTGLTSTPAMSGTTMAQYCYEEMFWGCTSLTRTMVALSAATMQLGCYKEMFKGCTSLVTPPSISATTLAESCFEQMFMGCTAMTSTPTLPVTTLQPSCYKEMFKGCTSLTVPPALPATTLASYCYNGMFANCTGLTYSPNVGATVLQPYCYLSMFEYCTSISSASLPNINTWARYSLQYMFRGCSSLNSIVTITTTWNEASASGWVSGVAANGIFQNLGQANIPSGQNGIPLNWSVYTTPV